MINLKKFTQSKANTLVDQVAQSAGVAEANAMFGNKTFQEANAGSKILAIWFATIAQLISAGVASSYVYFKIALPSLPFEVAYLKEGIAILLSLLILAILEILKKHLFSALFVSFYKSKSKAVSFKVWLIPICAVLTLISIYTSFEGAKLYVSQSDKSDTIAVNYQNQIAEIEAQEKAFKQSISWKGKIDTYNKTNAKLLAGFQDRKTALYQEKNKEIDVHKVDIEGKGYSVAIFSLFMEIVAVACFWFVCYVNFYTYIESKNQVPTDSQQENEQPTKIGFSQVPNSNIAPNGKSKVGFQLGVNTVNVDNGERQTVNVVALLPNERLCKLCGEKFIYKHWNAQYCTEEHRIEAWEKKTGKKFNKKKGGKQ